MHCRGFAILQTDAPNHAEYSHTTVHVYLMSETGLTRADRSLIMPIQHRNRSPTLVHRSVLPVPAAPDTVGIAAMNPSSSASGPSSGADDFANVSPPTCTKDSTQSAFSHPPSSAIGHALCTVGASGARRGVVLHRFMSRKQRQQKAARAQTHRPHTAQAREGTATASKNPSSRAIGAQLQSQANPTRPQSQSFPAQPYTLLRSCPL
jgi:hypothetical protein